ncbi:cleavage and polyadenylation specificity factor (cpsf) a subunit protein [Anaeramoeba ignava]|uniref:Cleavage and polyadenylation specificity factor (Cpsf) a subunit protein n=1 Tax=Anaeramoeba ignava TaxID=1746090 RepID=A0A9Q0RD30_ANAIG|nr:cleavage and polyadenylation specificity factor (cpsf) a subunit protein [Anaeramoeba ignava]
MEKIHSKVLLSKTLIQNFSIQKTFLFNSNNEENSFDLIISKNNSIELINIDLNGKMKIICQQNIFGMINNIELISIKNESTNEKESFLVILSEEFDVSLIGFSYKYQKFFTLNSINLKSIFPKRRKHHFYSCLSFNRFKTKIYCCWKSRKPNFYCFA